MLLALLTPACVVVHEVTEEEAFTSADAVDALLLDGDAGDVRITGGDGDLASVTRTLRWTGHDRPDTSMDETGGTLELRADCGDLALFCAVDWEITLPRAAVVDLDIASGDVSLEDLDGAVRARVGSGDLTLEGLSNELDIATGSGDLTLRDLAGEAQLATSSGSIDGDGLSSPTMDASTDSGDVRLVFAADAATTDLLAFSGSGDVALTTPSGAWDLDVWTASGEVSLFGVEDDSAAGRHLTAHSTSGDIEVVGG